MQTQNEILHAKFDKWINLGKEAVHFKGNFLFCQPYVWEEHVDWNSIKELTKQVSGFVKTRVPGEVLSDNVESSTVYAFCSCPPYWRHKSLEDPKISARLVFYCQVLFLILALDDLTEAETGKVHYSKFVLSVGSLTNRILQYEFANVEDICIRKEKDYEYIVSISSDAGPFLELFHDVAETLKTNFEISRGRAKHFARFTGRLFAMQTWCGMDDQTHLLNPYTQYHLRVYTGGISSCLELIFLLEGISIPRKVRDNAHWLRCFEMAAILPPVVNDVMGIQKEYREKMERSFRVDNAILHYMEVTNCTFEQALARLLREHNLILLELHQFLDWSKTNRDYLYDLNEDERDIFQRSTTLMGECIGLTLQSQVLMRRYNSGLEITFENDTTIYGMAKNQHLNGETLCFK